MDTAQDTATKQEAPPAPPVIPPAPAKFVPAKPTNARPIPPEPVGVKVAIPANQLTEIPIEDGDLDSATIQLRVWGVRQGGWVVNVWVYETGAEPESLSEGGTDGIRNAARVHPLHLVNLRTHRKLYAHCAKATTLYVNIIQPQE